MISFTIGFSVLRKNIKLNLGLGKFFIKPVICTIMMAICSYALYMFLNDIIAERIASAISMIFAVIIYILALLAVRVLNKEDIFMLPYGQKIYNFLVKLRIYKEN